MLSIVHPRAPRKRAPKLTAAHVVAVDRFLAAVEAGAAPEELRRLQVAVVHHQRPRRVVRVAIRSTTSPARRARRARRVRRSGAKVTSSRSSDGPAAPAPVEVAS